MKQKRARRFWFLVLILSSLGLSVIENQAFAQATKPTPTTQTPTPTAPSTGQRIGSIIKDAISTAFPGVSGIEGLISTIWKAKPTTATKIDQPQLTTAVTSSQDAIKKSIVAQAQQNLKGLDAIATELQVVSQFGVPTTTASGDIIRISDRLSSGKTLSDDDWTAIKADWKEAAAELATVKNADVSKIEDKWLRDKLSSIQQTNITFVSRIEVEMAAKSPNVGRLKDLLDRLYPTLQDISAAVGYEVTDMQAEIKALSDWAKGAAGSDEKVITSEGKTYIKFLNDNVSTTK